MNESLVIEVQFPLTSWEESFDIYKVLTTKVLVPAKEHCSQINDLPEFIAMGRQREYFIAFEEEQKIVEAGERPIRSRPRNQPLSPKQLVWGLSGWLSG